MWRWRSTSVVIHSEVVLVVRMGQPMLSSTSFPPLTFSTPVSESAARRTGVSCVMQEPLSGGLRGEGDG